MTQLFKFVISEHLDDAAALWLAERCNVVRCRFDDPSFVAEIADADALVLRTYTRVDEALLDQMQRVKVIGRAGAGVDNIDADACAQRGITVIHTPDANTQAVVEYVSCLLADALRPRVTIDGAVDQAHWETLRATTVADRQMSELTLGILGLGRIGQRVAHVASAIGMNVLYNDLIDVPIEQRFGAQPVDVEELFERSDVGTVHIDGRPCNARYVSASLIERMKNDVVFINTSRGFVVDHSSLAAFLRTRPMAQALLDVHDPEPIQPDNPLLGLPNVKLYPHLASRTRTALANMSWVVKDVWAELERRSEES